METKTQALELRVGWAQEQFESMHRQFKAMEESTRFWPFLETYEEACAFVEWLRTQPRAGDWRIEALKDGRVSMTFIGSAALLVAEAAELFGLTDGSSAAYSQVQEAIFLKKLGRTIYG